MAELPVTTWNHKTEDRSIRHIGPVAQDFHGTFEVGNDDKHLAALDANGVALAAIQGLNEVVKEKDGRLAQLELRNSRLEQRLAELEKLVGTLQAAHMASTK